MRLGYEAVGAFCLPDQFAARFAHRDSHLTMPEYDLLCLIASFGKAGRSLVGGVYG
jgi:hypothetical protein